jgi:hypothetical protein
MTMTKSLMLLAVPTFLLACGGAPTPPATPTTPTAAGAAGDADGDGVADPTDKCPDKKEDGQSPEPNDGCPKT